MEFRHIFNAEKERVAPTIDERFSEFKVNLSKIVSLINRAHADIGVTHKSDSGDAPVDGMETAHKSIDISEARKELGKRQLEWIVLKSDLIASHSFETPDDGVERNNIDKDFLTAGEHLKKLEMEALEPLKKAS